MPPALTLIANPVSGGNARASIDRAVRWFRSRGVEPELILTGARGDASAAARDAASRGVGRLVAAGGDGTLNEVINGLAPAGIPLALLPLGTTNVFALEAGIPFEVEAACRIALEGEVTPICLGLAGETRFLLMAGIGFDAAAVYGVSHRLKRWTGKLAYLASALGTFFGPPPPRLEMDLGEGRTSLGYSAVVGNGRLYGGKYSITPEADLREPALQVCLFRRWSRLQLLGYAVRIASGRRLGPPEVEIVKTSAVTFRGAPAPVQIDGDYLGRLPMTFRALSGELRMVLPPSARERKTT